MVFNMEPPFPPILVGIFEFILYVLGGKVLFQLKSRTPDYIHFFHGGVRLEAEKCAEKFEVWRDFEECFAQMYEDRKVDDGIGIKMYVLKSVKVQNSSEKNQKPARPTPSQRNGQTLPFPKHEPPGDWILQRSTPPCGVFLLQQLCGYQCLDLGLGQGRRLPRGHHLSLLFLCGLAFLLCGDHCPCFPPHP